MNERLVCPEICGKVGFEGDEVGNSQLIEFYGNFYCLKVCRIYTREPNNPDSTASPRFQRVRQNHMLVRISTSFD